MTITTEEEYSKIKMNLELLNDEDFYDLCSLIEKEKRRRVSIIITIPVSGIVIGKRLKKALKAVGIESLSELSAFTKEAFDSKFYSVNGVGKTTHYELADLMEKHNIKFSSK